MRTKVLSLVVLVLICFSGNSYCQSDDVNKIKDSFLRTVKNELISLQQWGLCSKDKPDIALKFFNHNNTWHTFYSLWSDNFTYDIKKTDSIVSSYIGIVTFNGEVWEKSGKTKEDCLRAPWKPFGSELPGMMGSSERTAKLKYSYQNGGWVLIEKPRVYKEY